jgi:hypothetical protein
MSGLALGCSHTAGTGIVYKDCYISVLSDLIGCSIVNQAESGSNHTAIQHKLVQALQQPTLPDFVIAQWPNPFRRITYHNGHAHNENINASSPAFEQLLRQSEQNFYQPWLDTIVVCNLLCRSLNIKCINIMIEDVAAEYHAVLTANNIVLHTDQKLPGKTWLMDSAASDNLHHSAHCHKQWAERIFGLLNEHTTP